MEDLEGLNDFTVTKRGKEILLMSAPDALEADSRGILRDQVRAKAEKLLEWV